MERYLVISSDTHAGPPSAAYRDYVDPQYREAFDDDLATAAALRSAILESASEEQERFRKEWDEETGDGGKLASYDPSARNAELDKEGIAAEVVFPDADVLGGGAVGAVQRRAAVVGRARRRAGHGRSPGSQPLAGRSVLRQPRAPLRRGDGADPARHPGGHRRDAPLVTLRAISLFQPSRSW